MQAGSARRNERSAPVLGHRGTGGSVGLCVPQGQLAIAVTLNQLSARRHVTRRLLTLALDGCATISARMRAALVAKAEGGGKRAAPEG